MRNVWIGLLIVGFLSMGFIPSNSKREAIDFIRSLGESTVTIEDPLTTEDEQILTHISTPSNPTAGTLKFYSKSDDSVYLLNSAGTESELATFPADLTTDVTGILPIANGGTGSATQNFVDLTTAQSVAGEKTFSDNMFLTSTGAVKIPVGTTAQRPGSPQQGQLRFNSEETSAEIYDGTTWTEVGSGAGGGGGSFVWELNGDVSPIEEQINGFSVFSFDDESEQEIYALIVVPSSYETGDQILLKNTHFTSSGSSDNVFFKTQTTLYSSGGSTAATNTHDSTNSEVTLSSANIFVAIGNLDLTDGSGQINSVGVNPGDILVIRFFRDNANETSSSADDASFVKFLSSIDFTGEP